MRNRLAALLAALTIVAALPSTVAAASNGGCDWTQSSNYFGGLQKVGNGSSGTWKTGVRAEIYTDTSRFDPCTNPNGIDNSMASQWVALEGAANLDPCDLCIGGNNIVQVGVIRCGHDANLNTPLNNPCHDSKLNDLRYFAAAGADEEDSCGFGGYRPIPVDLGPAPEDQWVVIEVRSDYQADEIGLYINFVKRAVVPMASVCWVANPKTEAAWRVETWDPFDGLGGVESPARFRNMYYKDGPTNGLWRWDPYIAGCASASLDPWFRCQKFGDSAYGFYTTR